MQFVQAQQEEGVEDCWSVALWWAVSYPASGLARIDEASSANVSKLPKNKCLFFVPCVRANLVATTADPDSPDFGSFYPICTVSRYRATAAFHLNFSVIACCNDCAAAGSPCVRYTCFGVACKPPSQRSNSLFPACAENCPISTISARTDTACPNKLSVFAPSCNARPRVPSAWNPPRITQFRASPSRCAK